VEPAVYTVSHRSRYPGKNHQEVREKMEGRQWTFEDLRGLRAEGYIRDSTLDQRDGSGPEIQRHNEERFAQTYGLDLGNRWYTEFVSGRSVVKRKEFQKLLEDAALDLFDVLLVDNTSRFGRNQAECIRYKEKLQRLGKVVIFVSQGIISGSDRDFLSERINETLDEQYSRNLSRYVKAGFAEKAAQGRAIGKPPLGYCTEKSHSGRGAWCVPDPDTMPTLLAVLRGYSTGKHSFRALAQELNAQGRHTASGKPFTESSISTILNNRFYEGKVVYHRDQPDEQIIEGTHEVPREVRDLWEQCQVARDIRNQPGQPGPRSKEQRIYPLTGVLICDECGEPFHGIGSQQRTHRLDLRMVHSWRRCGMHPQSVSAPNIEEEFAQKVLGCIVFDDGWKDAVLRLLATEGPEPDNSIEIRRIDVALANLKKQHLWGAVTDQEFKDGFRDLQQQRRTLVPRQSPRSAPNLDRAAKMLQDLPALWQHPGVSAEQRRDLARVVFEEIRLQDGHLTAIKPQPQYAPLFAYALWSTAVGGECSP
jgi:DNA invertase Pin-like site-specific DNA recombinase